MVIRFELSTDPAMREEYYSLREHCYRDELGLTAFDGAEEQQDRTASILLAIRDGLCVGGARISADTFPWEHLPEVGLSADSACIWERLALKPEYRTVTFAREFCANLVNVSRQLGYRQALVLSSLRNARFYRMCHAAIGVGFSIVRPVPDSGATEFAGLEHYLSVSRLQEVQMQRGVAFASG